ncbi:MAG: hypothetical protein AB7F86_20000 [Bdellovibrionales bacterium]
MSLRLLTLILGLSTAVTASAETETRSLDDQSTSRLEGRQIIDEDGVADHDHFFRSGIRAFDGAALSFGYGYRFGGQLILGTDFSVGQKEDNKSGGSLDNAQYYKEELKYQSTKLEANATIFFRENGYGRWGFLLRTAVGHAWNSGRAKWGRYDRDPAIFIFGDDKRLRESQETNKKWESTYARLGGYYQFVWGFRPEARVGHILEIGAGAMIYDTSRSLSYVKPNGEKTDLEISKAGPVAEINYSIAF